MIETVQGALTMNVEDRQTVSDLADGRLMGEPFAHAVELVATHSEGREIWHRYHLIGDVLRGLETASVKSDSDFVNGLKSKLALEPTLTGIPPVVASAAAMEPLRVSKSANDNVFRWRMVAGLASLTAVLALGWNMVDDSRAKNGARLAQSADSQLLQQASNASANGTSVEKGPQIMLRDPHLDALMAAHKQFGGTSALQMPAGFIRNATFESNSK